jgi:exodeoxyribonuclease V alpha subunit
MTQPDTAQVFAKYFAKDSELTPSLENLYRKMEEGHLCVELEGEPQDRELIAKDDNGSNPLPFVSFNGKLYTGRFFYYETLIVDQLKNLAQSNPVEFSDEVKNHIRSHIRSKDSAESLSSFTEEEKPDWQLIAAVNACMKRLCIITGGPGTGKTTTVAKILSILNKQSPGLKIELAAPTGKAAIRMKESLLNSISGNSGLDIDGIVNGLKPKTIHRLLGPNFQSPFFKSNRSNPLKADVLIVDESSMIGAPLFAKLLDAVAPHTRLILLGDSNQLSSVDSGSVFGDLCAVTAETENKFNTKEFNVFNDLCDTDRKMPDKYCAACDKTILDGHVIRLHKTYRYDRNSAIGQLTANINAGNEDGVRKYIANQVDGLVIDQKYSATILDEFVKHYMDYILEEDIQAALIKLNKVRVLCAVRESKQGIYFLNGQIEAKLKRLFRDQEHVKFNPSDTEFYQNQPILVTQNIRELMLYNGDVGIIRKNENGRMMAYFPATGEDNEYGRVKDKPYKAINPGLITNWETVFAMTIHKSQGSEFDNVLVVLPQKSEHKLLSRELIYTAITRGKTGGKVVVQTEEDTLMKAVEIQIQRVSGIADRLTKNKV